MKLTIPFHDPKGRRVGRKRGGGKKRLRFVAWLGQLQIESFFEFAFGQSSSS